MPTAVGLSWPIAGSMKCCAEERQKIPLQTQGIHIRHSAICRADLKAALRQVDCQYVYVCHPIPLRPPPWRYSASYDAGRRGHLPHQFSFREKLDP